jgi:predicted dehydrogenase
MTVMEGVALEDKYRVRSFRSIDEALSENPDVAFITTITSEHVNMAVKAAQAGCHLFIEKPLSDSMEGINELRDIIHANRLVVYMGFNMRHHPCLIKLKRIIETDELGSIISVRAAMGERLTTIHSYEDYRTTYMANRSMGGGLILTQLIHELDYLRWLLGDLEVVAALITRNHSLGVDIEDSCDALLRKTNHDSEGYPVSLHGDFWQYPPCRLCEVIFERGRVLVDMTANELRVTEDGDESVVSFRQYERNDSFIEEIKELFDAIEMGSPISAGYEDGVRSLELALAIMGD